MCDGGNLCDQGTFSVTVNRNFGPPVFQQPSYETTIGEDQAVLSSVIQVAATDSDLAAPYNTFTYRMEVDNLRFSIDPTTGVISVRRPLNGETQSYFDVCIFLIYIFF